MSTPDQAPGSTTAAHGTPVPVEVTRGRTGINSVVFLAGPVIWTTHFLLVYFVTEAGCSASPGLDAFDPPVPEVVTLVATAVAAVASLWCARWAYRRWRAGSPAAGGDGPGGPAVDGESADSGRLLTFVGFLLSLLSFVIVLFVGLPALVLSSC